MKSNNTDLNSIRSLKKTTVREQEYKFEKVDEISNYLTVSVQKILSLNSDV